MRTPLKEKELELADEQVAQKRYSQNTGSQGPATDSSPGPRSNFWTGTGMPASRVMPTGQLVGRVALATPDPDLAGGSDFYIGEARADIDGVDVFELGSPRRLHVLRGHPSPRMVRRGRGDPRLRASKWSDCRFRRRCPPRRRACNTVPQAGPVYPDSPEQVTQPTSSETHGQARCGARVEGGDTCCGSVGWLHPPCRGDQSASCAGAEESRRPED